MVEYPSTIARALPEVGGDAVTIAAAAPAEWDEREKVVKVTGTINPYGAAGHVLVFEVTAATEVTDVTNASVSQGVHDMVALGEGKTNTERSVIFYIPLSSTLPREKIRVDWDGYHPEDCEVFWIDASEATFADEPDVPEEVTSVYQLTKQVLGVPIVGNEFRTDVTLSTAVQGNTALEKVRFRYHFDLPSVTASAEVRGEDGTEFEDDGFWGPAEGFTIPAQYNSTSKFWVILSEAGTYTVTLELFNVETNEVILTATDSYTV